MTAITPQHLSALLLVALGTLHDVHASAAMTREDWVAGAPAALANSECRADSYFVQCYSVEARECRVRMTESAESCLPAISSELPSSLAPGHKWMAVLARCALADYAKRMRPAFKADECDEQIRP